jgi:hypothetical protein
MPTTSLEQRVRKSLPHYLSDEVASGAGLTLAELQQAVFGAHTLGAEQVEQLARRMKLL